MCRTDKRVRKGRKRDRRRSYKFEHIFHFAQVRLSFFFIIVPDDALRSSGKVSKSEMIVRQHVHNGRRRVTPRPTAETYCHIENTFSSFLLVQATSAVDEDEDDNENTATREEKL